MSEVSPASEPVSPEGEKEPSPKGVGSHDLATLGAVADFVINLSIGARNHQIYGVDHPTALHSVGKMEAAMRHALDLCDPLELHFTPEAVFCGVQCLERGHPIYRRFAERMWRLGIVGLTLRRNVHRTEVMEFISLINRSRTENWNRRDTEEALRRAALPNLELEFLHELMSYESTEEVRKISQAEQEQLWEDFMAQLARFRALGPVSKLPRREGESPEVPMVAMEGSEEDYAEAVIDYMKELERSKRQDALLGQTNFGRKISDFLKEVNPNLRHQIMSSAIHSQEIEPETLQRLVGLVGQDHFVESLRRLNETGASIPPTAFRALSLLSMVREDGVDLSEGPGQTSTNPENVQQLLDGLMAADRASTYTSPEYEKTIQNIQGHARDLVQNLTTSQFELNLSPNEAEKHFLYAAEQILDRNQEDVEITAAVDREAEAAYTYFIEAGIPSQCRQAMKLARRARDARCGDNPAPYVWETEEVLGALTETLSQGDRWKAEDSGYLLTTIGAAAVPPLVEILQMSENISARKRALSSLVTMTDDPVPQLLPLLNRDQPWYVQRNIIHVLRRRKDPSGLEAAKVCWKTRKRRLQGEILSYLLSLEDPEATDYLWRGLQHPDWRVVLDVVRIATRTPRPEVVETIEQHIDGLPSVLVGSRYHISLLRLLALSDSSRARRYVEQARDSRQPLFLWTRRRFQSELDDILHE